MADYISPGMQHRGCFTCITAKGVGDNSLRAGLKDNIKIKTTKEFGLAGLSLVKELRGYKILKILIV